MIKVHSDWELRARAIAKVASAIGSRLPWYFTAFSEICKITGHGIRRPGSQRFGKFDLNDVEGAAPCPPRLRRSQLRALIQESRKVLHQYVGQH